VFRSLGWKLIIPSDLASLLRFYFRIRWGKKERFGFLLIWKTVVWTLWRFRTLTSFWRKRGMCSHLFVEGDIYSLVGEYG